jgi:catecholate siderophore receptor
MWHTRCIECIRANNAHVQDSSVIHNDGFAASVSLRHQASARDHLVRRTVALVLALSSLGVTAARAEDAAAPANDDSLTEVVVVGVRLEDQVSPLQRRINSVLGLDMSILDLPRSVTAINAAQIRDQSVISVTDFSKIVSSAYTTDQFGGANVPWLRGQAAEVFQNGMQRTPRSDGQPLSFNSVEGFDIVKGPAGVVYGPTGSVGGYVNLVTKRPFFDTTHASTTLTYGDYNTRRGQLDVSGPLSDTLAYRVSYEGEHSDRYYRYGFTHSSDVYAALRWKPSSDTTVDLNTEYYSGRYTENTGINRPTQELIDHGVYYQGTGVSTANADPRGFRSRINVTGVTQIDRSDQLVAPTDYDIGSNFQVQLDVTHNLSDNITIANKAYWEDYTQLQYEYAQRYFNDIRQSGNFEDRFELRGTYDKHQFITGVSYRQVRVLAFGDFFNEYLNATDITGDPSKFPITTNLFGVVAVPGRSAGTFATPGAKYPSPLFPNAMKGTQDQDSHAVGLFFQDLFQLTDKLSVLGGVRADFLHESLTDPLPPAGFAAAHDTASEQEWAGNLSVTYKVAPWASTYATVNYNESPVTSNGGGYDGFTGTTILDKSFHIDNYLYEVGSKFALDDDRLFISNALFYQERAQTNQLGVTSKVRTKGVELEANYQPNEHLSATAGYSYLDAVLPNAGGGLSFTRNVYDAFLPPYGTGAGSPNFAALPLGDYRLPGVPRHLFSAFAKYRTSLGLGASLGTVVTSPILTSYFGNVEIPTQYTLDGAVFYETSHWDLRLDLYNITDEKNWTAEAGSVGNDLISAAMPFHLQARLTFRF